MQILSSTYLSAHKVPSLKSKVFSGCVVLEECDKKFNDLISAVDTNYGCSTGMVDSFVVRADETESLAQGNAQRALTFVCTNNLRGIKEKSGIYHSGFCSNRNLSDRHEIALVQLYEVRYRRKKLSSDKIDTSLGCVIIRLQQRVDASGTGHHLLKMYLQR